MKVIVKKVNGKKIIIYGINDYCLLLFKIVNKDKTEIIAYVDNEKQSINEVFNDKPLISIYDISNYYYDYILVLGDYYNKLNYKINNKVGVNNGYRNDVNCKQ